MTATDPRAPRYPAVPEIDERANRAFLDRLVDTDGRPNDEAEDLVEREGFDDEDEDDDR